MNLKHYIFDLDGTLIDTENAILKTWQDTLKEYGYDYTLEEIRVVLGVTTDIGLKKLNANVDENYICKWQANYEKYCSNADFFEGAKEMLEFLKENNRSLGAVSSRSKNEYDKYFRKFNLEEFFTTIVLEDDTENHKPYPDPLFKYMELTGADKDSCIYIGDMTTDIQCANNAGVISGLVAWNNSGVSCSDAKMSFSDPKEVCDLVNAAVCSSSY
ncbi:HAD family hydrolase [Bacillus sp. BAU-SS-2023]|nr:HAD family hydrolase [Bacillus sp. BAU-SS-2023]